MHEQQVPEGGKSDSFQKGKVAHAWATLPRMTAWDLPHFPVRVPMPATRSTSQRLEAVATCTLLLASGIRRKSLHPRITDNRKTRDGTQNSAILVWQPDNAWVC